MISAINVSSLRLLAGTVGLARNSFLSPRISSSQSRYVRTRAQRHPRTLSGLRMVIDDVGTEVSNAPISIEEEKDPGEIDGLRIVKYPHPSLRAINEEVTEFGPELTKLARTMFKLMYACPGVGLAAPQVGVNKRLMVFNPEADPTKWLSETILVNPKIVSKSESTDVEEEGCLSFPGMRGPVKRSKWIKVEAFNARGQKIKRKYTDWEARIFQHEYDHLDATCYIDRLDEESRKAIQPALDTLIANYGEGGKL